MARKPDDAEAWRLLGETSLLSTRSSRAVEAYEKAVALRTGNLQVGCGVTGPEVAG